MKYSATLLLYILVTLALFIFITPTYAQTSTCANPYVPVATPLNELGTNEYVRLTSINPLTYTPTGEIGGLYGNGSNERPAAHNEAGIYIAQNEIKPLDLNGNPDPVNGRIVMVSLGMSNTQTEFNKFMQDANADPAKNPKLVLVNGAISGGTSDHWADPNDYVWTNMANNVRTRTNQVQVAWIKVTRLEPLSFPDGIRDVYQPNLEQILRNLKQKYPNIKLVLFSSRMRGYSYINGLSPEPTAYETAFGIRWVIQKQVSGDPTLNYDPSQGPVVAPFAAWGPYMWIDGLTPNILGQLFPASYLTYDCTHPMPDASQFISNKLQLFLKTDSIAQPWYLAPGISITPTPTSDPTPTPTTTSTPTPTPTAVPQSNIPPVVAGTTMGISQNQSVDIPLSYTDPDGPGPYSISIVSEPLQGSLTGSGTNRTYTPNPDYLGPDSFSWQVFDGINFSTIATVTIMVQNLDLETNLASHWNFLTNSANNTASTCTNCTVQGATWTPEGKIGGAFDFDGTNDSLNVGSFNYLDNASSFTYTAWIKPDFDQTSSMFRTIVTKPSQLNIYYFPNINDWRISLRLSTTNNAWVDTTGLIWTAGTWHHIAVTYDGMNLKLYWDGVLANTKPYTGYVYASTSSAYLGSYPGIGYYFDGLIDEVRVYRNRAFTSSEISQTISM